MSEHRAWLRQASADYSWANRVLDLQSPADYCHVIAKYQQAVEKSIKAVIIGLRDHRGMGVVVGRKHEVYKYMSVLTRLPRRDDNREIQSIIHGVFDQVTHNIIRQLDSIVPRLPERRNTEYPFPEQGHWVAPADDHVFSRAEVTRFRDTAHKIVSNCFRVASALEHGVV